MKSACTTLTALTLAIATATPAAGELRPHRAAYTVSMASSNPGTGIVAVDGALGIEWRLACDGWVSRQRLAFDARSEDGVAFSYDVRFSSWESFDHRRLRFTARTFDRFGLVEEFRGEATLSEQGGSGVARFTLPEPQRVALPAGTVFPTEHLYRLIEGARGGAKFLTYDVFDGSSFDALTRVTAVIGTPRHEPLATPGLAAESGDTALWPISMAYYNAAATADTPDLEVAFRLADDGLLRSLRLDYGSFALDGGLATVQWLPKPVC